MKPEADIQAHLAGLAARYELPGGAAQKLGVVVAELEPEVASITTVRDPAAAVDVHIADSLSGLSVAAMRDATTIADLGAGGGFPGLALAVALPQAKVWMVESVGRKCAFIDRVAEAAGIASATSVHSRAEDWKDGIGGMAVVTARALAPLGVILEYAAPLLVEGGHAILYKARRDADEERTAAAAGEILGMELDSVTPVYPFPDSGPRHLHVYRKAAPTPERFPRRAGMARKKPLGTAS